MIPGIVAIPQHKAEALALEDVFQKFFEKLTPQREDSFHVISGLADWEVILWPAGSMPDWDGVPL
ncbi:hypothetical protein [Tautonia rosea]|uniref:hypothetical protein n=1 Tax=Tautonia rosea TaxID=2728037 RepID=UPI0014740126|nr:hypothetical protein [Tautonia rosea]